MPKRICVKCGSHSLFTEKKGNYIGLYCSDCGAWQKWLGENEFRAFQRSQKRKNANYTHTTNDKETNAIQTINSFYNKEVQERQTIEEMSELTKALNKLWRHDNNVLHNNKSKEELLADLYEEIADVSICLQYLIDLYDCLDEVKKVRNEKFERELNRINS